MTLHDLAEYLRKAAYDLDEAGRMWAANEKAYTAVFEALESERRKTLAKDVEIDRLTRLTARRKRPAKKAKR